MSLTFSYCLLYGEMSLTVYTFLPRWNFISGWIHPCQKDRDEILSQDEKKTKRRVNTSSRYEILKWACFFNFWRIHSNMLSKVNMFEYNGSMNVFFICIYINSVYKNRHNINSNNNVITIIARCNKKSNKKWNEDKRVQIKQI